MMNGLPALALTAGVVNFKSLATTVTVSPVELPPGTALPVAAADVPEHAASAAARTIVPKVRVRRFTSRTPFGCRGGSGVVSESGAGRDRAAPSEEVHEGRQLAARNGERVAVVPPEVD